MRAARVSGKAGMEQEAITLATGVGAEIAVAVGEERSQFFLNFLLIKKRKKCSFDTRGRFFAAPLFEHKHSQTMHNLSSLLL